MTPQQQQRLRALPSVGALLETSRASQWCQSHPRGAVVTALRTAIDQMRVVIQHNGAAGAPVSVENILDLAGRVLEAQSQASLRRVINATGVVLHTGLGRAPLCAAALDAIVDVGSGYCNLEYDLERGKRGRRASHVRHLLCEVTGAESATVVNNNAAAMLLVMRALCEHREVVVSRGQLVEIGGSFRMPEVMAAGGAILREVGTTNRTRPADFEKAITPDTAALLRVHPSNYRIEGFAESVPLEEMSRIASRQGLLLIDDLGSGALFDLAQWGLPTEPFVRQSIEAGADVVCFSGDKLLGGPQAGVIVGTSAVIDRIEAHPLMRTYRVDKLVLAALEATLRQFADAGSARAEVPTLRMIATATEALAERAESLCDALSHAMPDEKFFVGSDVSCAGGGSLPGEGLPGVVIRWKPTFASAESTASALRRCTPPVIVRIHDDAVCLDVRTLCDGEASVVVDAVGKLCCEECR